MYKCNKSVYIHVFPNAHLVFLNLLFSVTMSNEFLFNTGNIISCHRHCFQESEARTQLLRTQSRKRLEGSLTAGEGSSSSAVAESVGHVNLFQEEEEGV